MRKNFVLDTNIFLDDHEALFGFEDNNIWITGTTLQELDKKKDVSFEARETIRILDDLRRNGDLIKGVPMPNGGVVFVESNGVSQSNLPSGYSIDVADNRIISTCVFLSKNKNVKGPVILVTNDALMRISATACGVQVQEYLNSVIIDSGYRGYSEIKDFKKMQSFHQNGKLTSPKNLTLASGGLLHDTGVPYENEYLMLKYGNTSGLAKYRNGNLSKIVEKALCGWIQPMNMIQRFMIDALLAPPEEVPLVIFSGPAGTAKTFLSLAGGLQQTYTDQSRNGRYRKVMISRPNVETDAGFGYLPGDLEAKMNPLLAPYYDNLEMILRGKNEDESAEQIQMQIEDMIADGVIDICPLAYIRGRSIPNAYIICDEAQNARRSLIRDIITRAGKGTKVVLCGDPKQVDSPTLDRYNNGLIYAIESMKNDPTTAIISNIPAKVSVRSELAKAAIQRMK